MVTPTLAIGLLGLSLSSIGQGTVEPRVFVEMLESLQPELEDFRCEYEGTLVFKDNVSQKKLNLNDDGVYDIFNGIFIWTNYGSIYVNLLHRHEPAGEITRELLIVKDGEAEQYVQLVDSPLGAASVHDPTFVNPDRSCSLGAIFLIDSIKRLASMTDMEATIRDEMIEGRNCSVLTFSQKGMGLHQRFWIDLQRGGHPIRREIYAGEGNLISRSNITLDQFEAGDATIWMPVSAVIEGHAAIKDGKPVFPKDPTSVETLYIVAGTLEFNKRPPPSTFKADYKPGTPISDNLRRIRYEFGQQKPERPMTRAEAESMLEEQLAQAEAQRSELVAGSPARRRVDWSSLSVWAFGICALVTSVVVLLRRR